MATRIYYRVTIDDVAANVSSVTLSDDTATYGMRAMTSGTIIAAAGTAMTNESAGVYFFDFNAIGAYESFREYEFTIKVEYAGGDSKYIYGTIPAQAEDGGYNEIEQHVLYTIGEDPTNPDVFTSDSGITHIRDSVNHAIWEVCFLTGSYIREFQIETVANQIFYELDTGEEYLGYILSGRNETKHQPLERSSIRSISKSDPFWMKTNGDCYGYFQIGNRILGIWYPPSTGGNVLTFRVAAIPGRYEYGTDPVKLRDIWEQAVIHYAISEYYASRGNAERATQHLMSYMNKMDIMRFHPDQTDKVRAMGENYWLFGGNQ